MLLRLDIGSRIVEFQPEPEPEPFDIDRDETHARRMATVRKNDYNRTEC